MKLQPDKSDVQTITGYGPGWIAINGEKISSSVVLGSRGEHLQWDAGSFEDLQPSHFAQLAELDCELVIFGSGPRLRFPNPAWLTPLMGKRMGLETMDTQAACRTFNILAAEGRHVALAVIVEGEQS
ncbi:MAG: hypothetical protein RL459_867 [Pseudomonadota bacterium]|jgi:uncharacterized protein